MRTPSVTLSFQRIVDHVRVACPNQMVNIHSRPHFGLNSRANFLEMNTVLVNEEYWHDPDGSADGSTAASHAKGAPKDNLMKRSQIDGQPMSVVTFF